MARASASVLAAELRLGDVVQMMRERIEILSEPIVLAREDMHGEAFQVVQAEVRILAGAQRNMTYTASWLPEETVPVLRAAPGHDI